MKHVNVALFVPHIGCKQQCSFCNQKTISGAQTAPTADDVRRACEIAIESGKTDPASSEIAFFGGSFTAIKRDYMLSLLTAAKPYIDEGFFHGVRISTRPDCVPDEVLEILKASGVTSVELGAQSMSDEVLRLNRRGHTADDVREASKRIKAQGFSLGLQMMTGLFGSSDALDLATGRELAALAPDTMRIYPTVVLENTELAKKMREGVYKPQTLDAAVKLCAELLLLFHEKNIPVIRLGLHSGGNVEEGYLAGAYHPAFRELCEGEIYLQKILAAFENLPRARAYEVFVPARSLSKAKGQGKRNEKALRNQSIQCKIKGNEFLKDYEILIKELEDDFKVTGNAGV